MNFADSRYSGKQTPKVEKKVWFIRLNVTSLPLIFETEPTHITSAIKYKWKRKHRGDVQEVVNSEYVSQLEQDKKDLIEQMGKYLVLIRLADQIVSQSQSYAIQDNWYKQKEKAGL
jgi:hypothetical protein